MPSEREIRRFLKRSGDDRFRWEFPCHETPDGWFNYWINEPDNVLAISQVYCRPGGEIRRLANAMRALMNQLECQKIVMVVRKCPDAACKILGGRMIGYVIEVPKDG